MYLNAVTWYEILQSKIICVTPTPPTTWLNILRELIGKKNEVKEKKRKTSEQYFLFCGLTKNESQYKYTGTDAQGTSLQSK